jgi:hypothetical protein
MADSPRADLGYSENGNRDSVRSGTPVTTLLRHEHGYSH